MSAQIFLLPYRPAIGPNGLVIPGASLTFYQTGTLIKLPVYTDATLSTPLTNPVVSNGAGVWPNIYYDTTKTYRVILSDASSAVLKDTDPYLPGVIDGLSDSVVAIINAGVSSSAASATASAASAVSAANSAAIASASTPFLVVAATSTASALANTANGQFSTVPQTTGYALDTYNRVSGSLVPQRTDPVGSGILATQKIALQGTTGTFPVAPVFSIYGIDAKFNDGEFIPNRQGPTPNRQYYQVPQITDIFGGCTITYGQPDPWGGNTAVRVQIPGTGNVVQLFQLITGQAGGYRVALMAKSATGAGNQDFNLKKNFSTPSFTTAITEGTWTLVDSSFSGLVTNDAIDIRTDSGSLDCYITIPQVGPVEIKQPLQRISATGGLVSKQLGLPGNILTDAFGNVTMPFIGRMLATDDGLATRSFSEMTMVMTFRQTAAGTSPNSPFYAQLSGQPDLSLGAPGGVYSGVMPGLTVNGLNSTLSPVGGGHTTIALGFNATDSFFSLGSARLATGTGTGGTAFQLAKAFFGGGGYNDTSPVAGSLFSFQIFDRKLSPADLSQVVRKCKADAALFGNSVENTVLVAPDGNGLSQPLPPGGAVGYFQNAATALNIKTFAVGVSSSGINEIIAEPRASATKALIRQAVLDGRPVIYSIMVFESAGCLPLIQAWIDTIRGLGAKFVLCTTSSRNGTTYASQSAFNANLAALLRYDALCDIGANATLAANNAYTNTTYFYDGLHWTQAGHDIAAPIYQAAIASLL
jgi:hypothetical protein